MTVLGLKIFKFLFKFQATLLESVGLLPRSYSVATTYLESYLIRFFNFKFSIDIVNCHFLQPNSRKNSFRRKQKSPLR